MVNLPMLTKYFWIILALGVLLVVQPADAQDKSKYLQARQDFQQKSSSRKEEERIRVTRDLVDAIYPEVEGEAVDLLIKQITDELARGGTASKEKDISIQMIDLCVAGLSKTTTEAAVDKIIKAAKSSATPWRTRFYILKGLGGINNEKVAATLVELIDKDKDIKIKMGAFGALAELKSKSGVEIACRLLNEEIAWEVKISAAEYLSKLNDQELIEPLIQVLMGKNLEGRARDEVAKILRQLTGADCGLQGTAWLQWWSKKKKGGDTDPTKDGEETTAVFYGIKITSTRIIFIQDVSGSMDWGADWKEDPSDGGKNKPTPKLSGPDGKPAPEPQVNQLKAKKEEIDKEVVTKRIHAAKRELANAIYYLDPSVYFTLVFYSDSVRPWKDTLVPATVQNKLEALTEIAKQKPLITTATFDALEYAYKLSEQGKGKVGLDKSGYILDKSGGADTIFLVSDGVPTFGKIIERPKIVEEIRKINETRKIKINTVAVGSAKGLPPGISPQDALPDGDFLKQLSDITGGIFVDRTTK